MIDMKSLWTSNLQQDNYWPKQTRK